MVLDAVERLGIEPSFCAGHSLGEYTALTATGALGFDDGVRLVVARADAMHEAGLAQPGHDGRRARPRRRPGRGRLPPRRRGRLGRQLQRPRPGRHRRLARRRRRGVEPRQGARRQEGHAAAGLGRVPHAVHDRRPATGCARRSPRPTPATPRCRSSSNVDALPHHEGKEWASLLSAQLSSPVRWKHCLQELEDLGVTDFVELGPGGVLTGMAKRTLDGARTISVATPEELDKLLEWVAPAAADRADRASRASTSSPASASSSARRRHLQPAAEHRRRHDDRRRHRARPRRRARGRARRSPARCRATSPSTPSGSRPASPSPGCGRAERGLTMPAIRPGAHGAVITGWGTALPPKMLTNDDLADMGSTPATSGSSSAPASASATSAARRPGCRSRPAGWRIDMSGLDPAVDRRPRPGHHHARPHACRRRRRPCSRARPALRRVRHQRRLLRLHVRARRRPRPDRHRRRASCSSSAPTRWPGSPTGRTATPPSCSPTAPAPSCSRPSRAAASCSAGTSTPTARAERFLYAEIGGTLKMDGKEVFRRAVRIMVDSAQKSMAHAGVTADDIALVVPHQANIRIIEAACDRLGIPHRPGRRRARPHRQHVVGVDPARPRRRPRRRPGRTRATSSCSSASAPA